MTLLRAGAGSSPAPAISRDRRARLRVTHQGAEPELRCPKCLDWWPIDAQFWMLNRWDECRACSRERKRLAYVMKLRDAEFREQERVRNQRYRRWVRTTAPDLLPAYDRMIQMRHAESIRIKRNAA